ncbi:MAG: DNA mismatch repair endonuclease MutL [Myxococcales bacterium]|nr:DNA mismatch repair endonuclease MutL [Myxococcales bacterium]
MPATIAVLDDALADQIAAGEVVERPASVVKELLDNAIDAGARRLLVQIEEGGRKRIRVTDDGSGMSAEDAVLSIRRHATSKLRTRDDLMRIQTLGFRGEALPSIASVSRFELTTRTGDSVEGTRVRVEGGAAPQVSAVGCAPGTTVEVRDLFYNVPARLKFLKARNTETGHVASVCTRAALSHPELALRLECDGRKSRDFLAVRSLPERVATVFPGEKLTTLEEEAEGLTLIAALGAPERARSGSRSLHLFVNGRPVRDASLARAIAFAYGSVLPPGRYPLGALSLTVPPDEVDVNVHPQKHEVRFADGKKLFDRVSRVLAKQLGTRAWGGPAQRDRGYWDQRLGLQRLPQEQPPRPASTAYADSESLSAGDPWGLSGRTQSAPPDGAPEPREPGHEAAPGAGIAEAQVARSGDQLSLEPRGFFASLRFVGQVRKMLLICEGKDALYILDQHAADERIGFDRLRRAHGSGELRSQRLLFPERVELSPSDAALVQQHTATLSRLGIDCRLLGPTTAAIHTIPALLERAPPERLLRDLLSELERSAERAFSDAIDMALATMACHGALRAGDVISAEQARALLENLDRVGDFAGHCPHGRPVLQTLPFDQLERKLGR